MVEIVRIELNILQRSFMGALLVLDVHSREIVKKLIEMNI